MEVPAHLDAHRGAAADVDLEASAATAGSSQGEAAETKAGLWPQALGRASKNLESMRQVRKR